MLSPDQLATLTDDAVPPWDIDEASRELRHLFQHRRRETYRGAAAFVAELLESSVVQRVVHPSAKPFYKGINRSSPEGRPLATAWPWPRPARC